MHYSKAMAWRSLVRSCLVLCTLCVVPCLVAAKKKPPPAPINLNTATSEELQLVPGIGPATADKILQMRKSYGAFKSVDDLLAIRGIGAKRLEKMRKYLVAGKSAGPVRADTPPPKSATAIQTPKKPVGPPPPPDGPQQKPQPRERNQ